MTERALPAIGVGVRPRPGGAAAPRPVARTHVRDTVRPAVARREAILTTPARAGMLVGASAAVYARDARGHLRPPGRDRRRRRRRPRSLPGRRRRRPAPPTTSSRRRIVKADAEVRALVADVRQVGGDVEAYQARLDALAALVAEVQGSAAALPARIKLPTVTMRGAVAGSSRSGGGTTRRRAPPPRPAHRAALTPSPAVAT